MKLKNFLEKNTPTAFEIVPNTLVMNVMVGDAIYGLDVDTTNIQNGTQLQTVSEYTLENDILTVSGLVLNANDVNMLGMEEEI